MDRQSLPRRADAHLSIEYALLGQPERTKQSHDGAAFG
jgi:hypothetical protein